MDILNTKIKSILTEKTNKIRPENIKSGVNILGINGSSKVLDTTDSNATAGDIITGKTAFVNGSKITGTYTGIIPTGTINITENGTVDVTDYASANVNVSSGGGGKNVQFNNQMHVTSYSYVISNVDCLKLIVAKTGTYKITRQLRRSGTSGTWGSQLYINGTAYGSENTTWSLNYYMNFNTTPNTSTEWQQIVEEHVNLQEGDSISVRGRSNSNGNWLYYIYLLIEEE